MHALDVVTEYCPAGQAAVTAVSPVVPQYDPAVQAVQTEDPAVD